MTDIQNTPAAPKTMIGETWYSLRRNFGAMLGLIIIVLLVFSAIFADFIAPHSLAEQYRDHLLQPPAWHEGGSWEFPLGTDDLGRCLLSRLIYGTRLSLTIGFIVVSFSLILGGTLGLLSGFYRGATEAVIMRVMDILLAVPSLLLALVIVAILGPGLINAMIAVAIVFLPHYARLMRAAVLTESTKDYVVASRVAGARKARLMFDTILPNCLAPMIVQATLSFSAAILDAAALGFLGLGAQPPIPEWGSMLASSLKFLQAAPWVVTYPGLAILITVLAFNILGDGLRDALDPKLKR